MKIEMRIGDKKIIEPNFDIYSHDKRNDILLIGIKNLSEEDEILFIDEIEKNKYKIIIENDVLGLELKNVFYSFNLQDCLKDFINEQDNPFYFIGFCFFDSNDIVKDSEISLIKMGMAW